MNPLLKLGIILVAIVVVLTIVFLVTKPNPQPSTASPGQSTPSVPDNDPWKTFSVPNTK